MRTKFEENKNLKLRAVVVAQLTERLLQTPQDPGSNPVIGIIYRAFIHCWLYKNKQEAGNVPLKMVKWTFVVQRRKIHRTTKFLIEWIIKRCKMFKRDILFFQISFRLYSAHFCRFIAKAAKDEKWCRQMEVFQSAQTTQLLRRRETEPGGIIRLIQHIHTQSVWPDLAIFCTLGNFSKRVARIIWPKSPTF